MAICRLQMLAGAGISAASEQALLTRPGSSPVGQFAEDHPVGTYILALSGHVVCVQNGTIWDSWDSSNENVLYYWERTDKA